MTRYALNRAGTVTFTVRNEDGTPTAPTGSVSVTVVDAYGTTVHTATATSGGSTGVYTYALHADVRGELGVYTVLFSYTVGGVAETAEVPIEVVGGLLFDIAEIRSTYPELSDAQRYTSAEIRAARDEATERLEEAAQVAFSTRRKVDTLSGDETRRLLLDDVKVSAVNAVSLYADQTGADPVDDEFDATQLADVEIDSEAGVLVRTNAVWPKGHQNVIVDYEYGYTATPAPVKRAAMRLAVEALVPNALPPRALTQSTDVGDFRISVANPEAGRPTGDPEVDAVILMFGRRRPTVG